MYELWNIRDNKDPFTEESGHLKIRKTGGF